MTMKTATIAHPLRLWHGADRVLEAGNRITAAAGAMAQHAEPAVEAVLEATRPGNALPRAESVFMIDAPDRRFDDACGFDAAATMLYEVEPIGTVYRNDRTWIAMIAQETMPARARAMAHAYWLGVPSPAPSWELRAQAAAVVASVPSLDPVELTPAF